MTTDIATLVAKQRQFFATQKTKDLKFRISQLQKLRTGIQKYEKQLLLALEADLRKAPFEGYGTEVGFVLEETKRHLKNIRKWAAPEDVATDLVNFKGESYIRPEPYGHVLIIGPWNFPFQLLFNPLVGAISAGNVVMLKPSEHAPHTAKIMKQLITDCFDEEYICFVEGDAKVATELLQQRFDYIFFTGNPRVGSIVMQAAAKYLTPVTLELGGKNPTIVDNTANIKLSARRIMWGKCMNAGQSCVAPDYILVHKDVKQKLVQQLTEAIVEFYGTNPRVHDDYSRIINKQHTKRIADMLQNCNIVAGGHSDVNDCYVAPTIVDNVSPEHPLMADEIFGPVLPIITFDTLDEAIQFVNQRPKPLSLYMFSESRKNIALVENSTSSGAMGINDVILYYSNSQLPFGGVGTSGMGAYHGKHSFDTFSHRKAVLDKSTLFDVPLRYPPYNGKMLIIKGVLN